MTYFVIKQQFGNTFSVFKRYERKSILYGKLRIQHHCEIHDTSKNVPEIPLMNHYEYDIIDVRRICIR